MGMWEQGLESVDIQRFVALPLLFQPKIASESVGIVEQVEVET